MGQLEKLNRISRLGNNMVPMLISDFEYCIQIYATDCPSFWGKYTTRSAGLCVCTDRNTGEETKAEGWGERGEMWGENDIKECGKISTFGESGCRAYRDSLFYIFLCSCEIILK